MPSLATSSLVVLTAIGMLLGGCGKSETPTATWQAIGVADVGESAQAQVARAEAARQELLHDMFALFEKVMGGDADAPSLEVCGPEAKAIATRVAADKNVRIGRTSWRLRNPSNVPPAWAATYVADQVEDEVYVRHNDGRVAALFPIRMQTTCTTCHGDAETMDEDIKALLAEHYPEDEATGFPYPGLRGYIWVEVPAAVQ